MTAMEKLINTINMRAKVGVSIRGVPAGIILH